MRSARGYYAVALGRRALRVVKQNLVFGLGMIVALVASDLLGWITLPWGVVGHEGSPLVVTLNGLRLLSGVRDAIAVVTDSARSVAGRVSAVGRPGVDAQLGEEERDRFGAAVAGRGAERDSTTLEVVSREFSGCWPVRSVVRDVVHRSPTGAGHVFVVILVSDVNRSVGRDRTLGSKRRRVHAVRVADVEHTAAAQAGHRSGSSVATTDIVKPGDLSCRLPVARPVDRVAARARIRVASREHGRRKENAT
jgi:hypothetical protein